MRASRARVGGAVLALGAVAGALAPAAGVADETAADPRVREVVLHARQVIPLEVALGQHVHVELPPGERFVNLAAGDTGALEAGALGGSLMLKPTRLAEPMSLTVVTSARAIEFEYRAVPASHAPVQRLRLVLPPAPAEPRVAPAVNGDYAYRGEAALRPRAAEDDGLHTRLSFGPGQALPAVYLRGADGADGLATFHVETSGRTGSGTTLVLHAVAERFVLRRGEAVGCVWNRAGTAHAREPVGHAAGGGLVRVARDGEAAEAGR